MSLYTYTYIYIYQLTCKHEQKMLVPMRGHSPHDHRWDEAVWVKGEIPLGLMEKLDIYVDALWNATAIICVVRYLFYL